ncbi:fimbrial biogenesis chaperone [Ewingella americana]|uniref:PapD family pilus assembly chaperone n=2 Tax=Ewingella americana TaxID=41202 RepID=A0A085GHQ3_EWIA3|nr:fimbria/pilus periplasmic chaperone [Ewingella americana]KAA8729440.1 fimbria/pilus periplasmic chaperone [Ewingella americana]KFC83248.1 PapD family pilus assembly chaperone [Ewingella americana ATCC 33852]STQ45097.1 Chaperone protein focC precursor [Ewingella americana]
MKSHSPQWVTLLCAITFSLLSTCAWSSVVISGTRVIYPAGQKEVTVKLDNVGSAPVLIQSWIDNGNVDTKPEKIVVPFILTPPINRVEPKKGQTLRVSYTGAPLPTNKESVFWLNVLEIPAKAKSKGQDNYLQVAFRSRIKLFFRPQGLEGNANDAVKSVTWKSSPEGLTATNPTPYFVSLVTVAVNKRETEGYMIPPQSSLSFKFPAAVLPGAEINLTSVNDYGAIVNSKATVK